MLLAAFFNLVFASLSVNLSLAITAFVHVELLGRPRRAFVTRRSS